MKYLELKQKLNSKGITIFNKGDVEVVMNLTEQSAKAMLSRYKDKGYIKNPKRGVYFFSDNPPSLYSLSYKIYNPSYISYETALSYYGIIPEVTYSITAATPKISRKFETELAVFEYHSIKTKAFTGYIKKDEYLIAEPEKALVDYLYLVALGQKQINDRLNLSTLSNKKILDYSKCYSNKLLDNLLCKMLQS